MPFAGNVWSVNHSFCLLKLSVQKSIVGNEILLVIYLEGTAAVINVKCPLLHFGGNYFCARHNPLQKEQS